MHASQWFFVFVAGLSYVLGFDMNRNDNLAVYWGQNSYGAAHSDSANFQKKLSFYCADDSIDTFPVAFMDNFFDIGGLPHIDLSNICNSNTHPVFPGSNLANCQFLASDIETCQSKGKIVTLSMGGSGGSVGFTSAGQASSFADQIWNLFLGGSSSTRPFGSAVLDGIDLDIEGGGTQFFDSFVNKIRSHAAGASKPYYITAAPQCAFPDGYLGTVLNAAAFDAVYVQFYNNYCNLANFNNPQDWDYSSWDNWAKNTAINKDVKIYIGAPAAPSAANPGSYVDAATLGTIIDQTRAKYSSFGGVMLWDASQAYVNNRFDAKVKSFLTNEGSVTTPSSSSVEPSSPTSTPTFQAPSSHTASSTSSTAKFRNCASVAAWSSGVAYSGGQQVVHNGHLWTAKWWTESNTPGSSAGDWTDDGACATAAVQTAKASASVSTANHATLTKGSAASAVSVSPGFGNSPSAVGTKPSSPNQAPTPSKHSRWFRF